MGRLRAITTADRPTAPTSGRAGRSLSRARAAPALHTAAAAAISGPLGLMPAATNSTIGVTATPIPAATRRPPPAAAVTAAASMAADRAAEIPRAGVDRPQVGPHRVGRADERVVGGRVLALPRCRRRTRRTRCPSPLGPGRSRRLLGHEGEAARLEPGVHDRRREPEAGGPFGGSDQLAAHHRRRLEEVRRLVGDREAGRGQSPTGRAGRRRPPGPPSRCARTTRRVGPAPLPAEPLGRRRRSRRGLGPAAPDGPGGRGAAAARAPPYRRTAPPPAPPTAVGPARRGARAQSFGASSWVGVGATSSCRT
jgi:hypothetical protein